MSKQMRKQNFTNMVFGALFFAIVVLTLVMNSAPQNYNVKAGDIAEEDIFAPWDLTDKTATERLKKEAAASVQPVYKLDLNVKAQLNQKVVSLFSAVKVVNGNTEATLEAKVKALKDSSPIPLTTAQYQTLITTDDEKRDALEDDICFVLDKAMDDKLTKEQLEQKKTEIETYFAGGGHGRTLNKLGSAIATSVLVPNMTYDEQGTDEKIAAAETEVKDVVIRKGTILVTKGEEVSADQVRILGEYGLLSEGRNVNGKMVTSLVLMIGIVFILFIYYIKNRYNLIQENTKLLTVTLIVQIAIFVIAMALKIISVYLMPVAANIIMISLLVGTGTAMLTGILSTIILGYLVNFNMVFVVMALLSTVYCVAFLPKKNNRKSIVGIGVGIGVLNLLVIASFGLFSNGTLKEVAINALLGLINGVFSAVLALGMLPFFETTFDLVTPTRLLEYSNPNMPVLKRLLTEAPGTYYHSILVGNLAEAAADEIGANALLCRVAANYHDIGKLKRPYYFKENQMTADNPHDRLKPELSAKIIMSHVEYGVELAKKNKLPVDVVDIIAQHHGDTLVAYFYYKAKKEAEAEGREVLEADYRYPQKRPQSKEAALVMLADSVEAYVRSLTEPTKEQVEAGVRKILVGKIQDGQLNECDISFKEIEIIVQTFVRVLGGIFHDRIEYPETIKEV